MLPMPLGHGWGKIASMARRTKMTKTIQYKGHKFLLNDSDGCYIEVELGYHTGYVGVNFDDGTADNPYCWSATIESVAQNIIDGGIVSGPTIEDNLQALFDHLIRQHRKNEYHGKFDPDTACNTLHRYLEQIDESSEWKIVPGYYAAVSR